MHAPSTRVSAGGRPGTSLTCRTCSTVHTPSTRTVADRKRRRHVRYVQVHARFRPGHQPMADRELSLTCRTCSTLHTPSTRTVADRNRRRHVRYGPRCTRLQSRHHQTVGGRYVSIYIYIHTHVSYLKCGLHVPNAREEIRKRRLFFNMSRC